MVPRGGLEPPTHGFSIPDGDIVEAFLDDRRSRGLSVQTIQFYQDYLERLEKGLLSPLLVTNKAQIRAFLSSLTCTPGGKHAYLRAARTFYNWAVEEEYIAVSPCKNVSVKVPNADRYTLSIEQLSELVAACNTDIQRLVVTLLADTGLRRSELASVRVSDVDLPSQTIRVTGKGKKRRVVKFGDVTTTYLSSWIYSRSPDNALLGLSSSGVSSLLVTLGQRTGIRCNAHSFRRLFACEAIRNGMNLFHVQSLLGHSALEMTRLYAHQVGSEDALDSYTPTLVF
jgi:site-specific recombinase XerD